MCGLSKTFFLVFRIKENELVKDQEKTENKRDGEKLEGLKELYQREQRKETERQAKQKRDLMQSHLVGSKRGSLSGTLKTFFFPLMKFLIIYTQNPKTYTYVYMKKVR